MDLPPFQQTGSGQSAYLWWSTRMVDRNQTWEWYWESRASWPWQLLQQPQILLHLLQWRLSVWLLKPEAWEHQWCLKIYQSIDQTLSLFNSKFQNKLLTYFFEKFYLLQVVFDIRSTINPRSYVFEITRRTNASL